MKKRLLTSICILLIFPVFSQSLKKQLNQYWEKIALSKREFSGEFIDSIKKTKTVFFYGKETGLKLDSLKTAITSAWTFTPILFESINKYTDYAGKQGYSYFIIDGGKSSADIENKNTTRTSSGVETRSSTMTINVTHLALILRTNKEVGLCRIELFPDPRILFGSYEQNYSYNVSYETDHYYNWSPVYLKANLEMVVHDLQNRVRPDQYEKYKIKGLSNLLASDTLYLSEALLEKYQSFKGTVKGNKNELFTSLKSPYRICTDSELYNIFITEGRGRFLFEFVKSSSFKLIKIFDMKSKEVVYKNNDNGYNLNEKDLARIYK